MSGVRVEPRAVGPAVQRPGPQASVNAESFVRTLRAAGISVSDHARPRLVSAGVIPEHAERLASAVGRAPEPPAGGDRDLAVFIDELTFLVSPRDRVLRTALPDDRARGEGVRNIYAALKG